MTQIVILREVKNYRKCQGEIIKQNILRTFYNYILFPFFFFLKVSTFSDIFIYNRQGICLIWNMIQHKKHNLWTLLGLIHFTFVLSPQHRCMLVSIECMVKLNSLFYLRNGLQRKCYYQIYKLFFVCFVLLFLFSYIYFFQFY